MPVNIEKPGLYHTVREVAQERGVESRTVQYWVDKGWLPAISIPSAAGTRTVVSIIHHQAWQNFTPPPPGTKAAGSELL